MFSQSIAIVFLFVQLNWLFTKGYTINQEQNRPKVVMNSPFGSSPSDDFSVSFSHIQLYVDKIEELHVYKQLEVQLNLYCSALKSNICHTTEQKKQLWQSLLPLEAFGETDIPFSPQNRDVVKQLLVGLGFRVSGFYYDSSTRSVLVTSRDPEGVQILVTAATAGGPSLNVAAMPTPGVFDIRE